MNDTRSGGSDWWCQSWFSELKRIRYILWATSRSALGNPSGVMRLVLISTPCWNRSALIPELTCQHSNAPILEHSSEHEAQLPYRLSSFPTLSKRDSHLCRSQRGQKKDPKVSSAHVSYPYLMVIPFQSCRCGDSNEARIRIIQLPPLFSKRDFWWGSLVTKASSLMTSL